MQPITQSNITSVFDKNTFKLKDLSLSVTDTDTILVYLSKNQDSITELIWENVSMVDVDFFDIINYLMDYQRNLTSITIRNFPFGLNSLYLEKLRELLIASKYLQSLDLSNNTFSSIDYGILMNACEQTETPKILNFSGCSLSEEAQENIKQFMSRAHNISDIIIQNSNLKENETIMVSSLFQRATDMPNASQLDKSIAPQQSAGIDSKKGKINMDYSTVEKRQALPKLLIRCECQRKLVPSDMFNCNTCCRSVCTYCTKNTVFCYSCVSCAKTHMPASLTNARLRNSCASCLECPICQSTLFIHDSKNSNDPSAAFFLCKFCIWNSKNYGIARESSDDLVKANFDMTLYLMKGYENFLSSLYDNQKAILQAKTKNPLLNYIEKDLARKNAQRVNNVQAQPVEATKSTNTNFYFQMNMPTSTLRANPFKNTLSNKFENEPDNPLYINFYKDPEPPSTKLEIIESYKMNEFNHTLYKNFPIKLYRSKNDYMIPKKKLQIYLAKNCKTCFKSLVNYDIQSDQISTKHTSFYLETNPIYQIKEVRLVHDDGAKTYRLFMSISNYSAYKFHLRLSCKNNCTFAGKEESIEHEFDFHKDIFNISSLKADSSTINNTIGKSVEVDFVVDPSDSIVSFSLTQTKTLVLQNRSVITDEIIIDFGTIERFSALFASS